MKKQLKGQQSFYDDKQRENVVSYYLMEDPVHQIYGVALEKSQENAGLHFLLHIEKHSIIPDSPVT